MGSLSLKGIGVGLLAMVVLSVLMGFLATDYLIEIYSRVVQGRGAMSPEELDTQLSSFFLHPLTIAFFLSATIIIVGVPAYLAAFVANRGFIENALAVGIISVLPLLLDYRTLLTEPLFSLMMLVPVLGTAFLGGFIRKRQVANVSNNSDS
jgi:hypothetical protein